MTRTHLILDLATAFHRKNRFLLALIFLPPLSRGQAPPAKAGEGPKENLLGMLILQFIIVSECHQAAPVIRLGDSLEEAQYMMIVCFHQ
jgi:hypothetical protein